MSEKCAPKWQCICKKVKNKPIIDIDIVEVAGVHWAVVIRLPNTKTKVNTLWTEFPANQAHPDHKTKSMPHFEINPTGHSTNGWYGVFEKGKVSTEVQ